MNNVNVYNKPTQLYKTKLSRIEWILDKLVKERVRLT